MIWSDFEFVIHLACIIKPRILDIIWPCLLIIMIMTWLFSGILFICALVVSFAARALRARATNDTTRWHYCFQMTLLFICSFQMTLLFICALVVSFAARALRAANDTTRAQINNIPSKSHVIPLLLSLCRALWRTLRANMYFSPLK